MIAENDPKVSVVMSVYKEPVEWLHESIDSILNQTFSDFEFIIICDNPNYKEGIDLLETYKKKDKRIVLVYNEKNIGLTKSLNKGLAIAKGEYIARMDADDISMPGRFEKQFNFMELHPEIIVLGTNISYIGDYSIFDSNKWIKYTNKEIKAQLLINSCFAHPTVFIRKSVLDNHNIFYDEDYRQAQDYRMWEILKDYGNYANLSEKSLKYRISNIQVSKKHNSKSNHNATIIRRRLISQLLHKVEINESEFFISDVLKARDKIVTKSSLLGKSNLLCLKKILYFSTNTRRSWVFLNSVFNGDFFKLNFFEKVRFLKIVTGYSNPITL